MRIGIVCYPTYGGSGIVATELGMSLAAKGHEVHFIAYNQPVRLELFSTQVHFHQVFVPEYPLFHYEPYELALSSKLVDTVKNYDLDILHVHYAIPHAYAAHNAKQMLAEVGIKIPIVTTLHGTDITLVGKHPFYRPAVAFSINKSDIVTCVSDSLKQDTIDFFDINREIDVLPNFIDHTKYTDLEKQCPANKLAKPDEKIISHVSNFRPVKRIEDVIRVFHGIQKKIPSRLIMVGEGPEAAGAQRLVRELGIEDKVRFTGKSNDVKKILCLSDLFLLPSEKESFGLSALEAMAAKTPVISSNTGGLPEVNTHEYSGYVCDVGNVEGMIEKGIHILEDEERLKQFKINAYKRSMDFDIDKIVPLYEKIYFKAIEKLN